MTTGTAQHSQAQGRTGEYIAIGLLFSTIAAAIYYFAPTGAIDYNACYAPAVRELIAGRSPYSVYCFYNPPWMLIPLIPFVLLGSVGYKLLFMARLAAYLFVIIRLRLPLVAAVLIMVSPPIIGDMAVGNIDWLLPLALVIPQWAGLFLLLLKPQAGLLLAMFWVIEACRSGGFRVAFRMAAPAFAALVLSLAIFGMYPLRTSEIAFSTWNSSLFPYSVPVCIALLAYAIRHRNENIAAVASPLISPYLSISTGSYILPLIGLARTSIKLLAVAVVGMWAFILLSLV